LSIGFFHLLKSSLDLSFIRNFPNLEDLRVGYGKFTGFEYIYELSNLKTLILQNITLDDVEFLSSAQIRFLMIDSCRLNGSLSCLANSKIETLVLDANHNLIDLQFLENVKSLKTLSIAQIKASKLFNFSALTLLEELHLQRMKSLESIAQLSSAGLLKTLYINELSSNVKAQDFNVLLELPNLENLYIDFLDYGKRRIEAVKKMFTDAGKAHVLKEGLVIIR
jgi:Leucine-rich repeat (LRR) protein